MPNPVSVNDLKDFVATSNLAQREHTAAVTAVLSHAASVGVDKAIAQFGGSLTPSEQQLIKSLKPDELKSLQSVQGKLGGLIRNAASDNNNNL